MKLDRAAFREAVQKALRAGPAARKDATLMIAREFGKEVQRRSPVDTGRFKRAEAQAINAAGAGPIPVPELQPGKEKERNRIKAVLTVQVRRWEKRVRELGQKGLAYSYGKRGGERETKAFKNAKEKLALSVRYLVEFNASEGTAAVIASEWWQKVSEARRRKKPFDPREILTRAYAKVYGGTGILYHTEAQTVISLTNKEPHAYIVEAKKGVRLTALNVIGRDLLARVGRSYVTQVARASGFATSA